MFSKFYSRKISRGKKDYKSFVLSSNIVTKYKKDYFILFFFHFLFVAMYVLIILWITITSITLQIWKNTMCTHTRFYTKNPIFNSKCIYIYKEWCIYVCLGCSNMHLLPNLTALLLSPAHLHEKAHHHLPFLCPSYLYINIGVCFLLFVCDQAFHDIFGIVGKPFTR
jgi:hypothetical protein